MTAIIMWVVGHCHSAVGGLCRWRLLGQADRSHDQWYILADHCIQWRQPGGWESINLNQSSFNNGMTERKPTIHKILYIG